MSILSITKKMASRAAGKNKKPAKTKDEPVVKVEKKAGVRDLRNRMRVLPILSEKSVVLQEQNTAVFAVPVESTKYQISEAVEAQFKVEVKAVRTMSQSPKIRRRGKSVGTTNRWKKAYVVVDNVQAIGTGP